MTRRVVTAAVLYVALAGAYLSQSGAPLRVHIAMLISLTVGFFVPALAIGSISDFIRRLKLVLIAATMGGLIFGALTTIVIVKAEFWDWWYVKYPALAVAFAAVLFVHAVAVGVTARWSPAA